MSAPPTHSQQPADDSPNAHQPSIDDGTSAQPSTPPKPVVAGVSKVESSTPIRVAVQNSRLNPKHTKHYVVKVNKEMDPYYVELPKFFENVFPEAQLPGNWNNICKAAAQQLRDITIPNAGDETRLYEPLVSRHVSNAGRNAHYAVSSVLRS